MTRNPAARHALETALLDLISQAEHLSLRRWLSPTAGNEVAVNGSGGVLDEQVAERVNDLVHQGYQTVKLKVGLAGVEGEIGLLQQLSSEMPADIRLRLDANGAWSRTGSQRVRTAGSRGYPLNPWKNHYRSPAPTGCVNCRV